MEFAGYSGSEVTVRVIRLIVDRTGPMPCMSQCSQTMEPIIVQHLFIVAYVASRWIGLVV